MLDRVEALEKGFIEAVKCGKLPQAVSDISCAQSGLSSNDLKELFQSQLISRHIDILARDLKKINKGFYTIGSSGHEGNAVLGRVFSCADMAFLHYRSGAFFIERARQNIKVNVVKDIILSLLTAKSDPIANGRHKVFGSKILNVPPQTSTIASHLPKAFGVAYSIAKARDLDVENRLSDGSIVICSFGDASLNHASAQTTFNATQWVVNKHYPLPILFVCEDNGLGISVRTPDDWVEKTMSGRYGIKYIQTNGLHIPDIYAAAKEAEYYIRTKRQPVFLHIKCVRLLGHAGSDVETQYKSIEEIEKDEAQDPLRHTARLLLEESILSAQEILSLYSDIKKSVKAQASELLNEPMLNSRKEIVKALLPAREFKAPGLPNKSLRQQSFGSHHDQLTKPRNLCQNINYALTDIMLRYPNVVAFGEDVAKKGGVYRVTAELLSRFGAKRVFDTLLDETTILGLAMGMAHNGIVPIPEIQFLAYLYNALDQLRGEAATLSFFSSGQYANPMVIRIPSFAYQKGFGGHYHNENSIATLRDIPGIIVCAPSNGKDAAMMLRRCVRLAYEQGRVVVFLEPIALYMEKDLHAPGDHAWLHEYPAPNLELELGQVGIYGEGKIAIVSYANGYYLSCQAQKILKDIHQIDTRIIDLRWLHPLPAESLLSALKGLSGVIVVDECRKSGSISELIITTLAEHSQTMPVIHRITGANSYITLGKSWQHLLPTKELIIEAGVQMYSKIAKHREKMHD